jgi:glyoxylase-like metal-dependent hydrolase (beta-lactamase superfamily II)
VFTIYITHGHGDHYFALGPLLKHFPNAKAYATKATMHLKGRLEPQFFASWWEASFPNQLHQPIGLIQQLKGNKITLEGHDIDIIEAGHSDTGDSTFVHIPDLSMVVSGDVFYNELHSGLSEMW